jgi:hypothetical protein
MKATQNSLESHELFSVGSNAQASQDCDVKAMQQMRLRALQDAEEAAEFGIRILGTLSHQGSQLENAENLALEQEYALARSRRAIRNNTWAGWLANMMTPEPLLPSIQAIYTPNEGRGDNTIADVEYTNRPQQLPGRPASSTIDEQYAAQEDYLAAQSQNTSRLHGIAKTINDSVMEQTENLAVIEGQLDSLQQENRALVRMQGRFYKKNRGIPAFKGRVMLQHAGSGKFLRCSGNGNVYLSASLPSQSANSSLLFQSRTVANRFTSNLEYEERFGGSHIDTSGFIWEAWERQDGVVGLCSCATGRWLGQTLLGKVRVQGRIFSHWEAFDGLDLEGIKEGPLLSCSANGHRGGWIFFSGGSPNSIKQPALEVRDGTSTSKRDAPKWRIHRHSKQL